jgi:hypothetical protein
MSVLALADVLGILKVEIYDQMLVFLTLFEQL